MHEWYRSRSCFPIFAPSLIRSTINQRGISMWNIIQVYRELGAHPFSKAVLTIIAVSTMFMFGAFLNIGIGFLPLIDKADMLILMSFYGSVLTVMIRLASVTIEIYIVAFKTIFMRKSNIIAPQKPDSAQSINTKYRPSGAILLASFIFIIGTIAIIILAFKFLVPETSFFKQYPSSLFLLINLVFLAVISASNYDASRPWRVGESSFASQIIERLYSMGERASVPMLIFFCCFLRVLLDFAI